MYVSKTDYILWRECPKNVWYKIHRPEIFNQAILTDFEKAIIETGNEVENVARQLFPAGILIKGRGKAAQKQTEKLVAKKQEVIFQPIFIKDNFLAAVDVLEFNPKNGHYYLYEVKSTTSVDKKSHWHDVAFQVFLLEKFGIKVKKSHIIHLNSEYVRNGEIQVSKLFKKEDITEQVKEIKQRVGQEMQLALRYLSNANEPLGPCPCIYKGRSSHCSTFKQSNPEVPDYSVHDISRIGSSKNLLQELVDVGIFNIKDISDEKLNSFSPPQKNQIEALKNNHVLIDKYNIGQELNSLKFPLYFLDYETFPSAIPIFDGFSPYRQIPFQYAGFVLESAEAKPKYFEFLHSAFTDPSPHFAKSLQKHIGKKGTVIVWGKRFECGINNDLAKRKPEFKDFMECLNSRIYDLMEIFQKQFYVHKDFLGRVSIKNVLPVLVPELSYKSLNIQEGGTASQKWAELVSPKISAEERQKIAKDLKEYCRLDAFAMYKIWQHLAGML